MLPQMLAHGIANTHWFWHFDWHRVVDFSGELKSNLDALAELAGIPGVQVLDLNDIAGVHNVIAEAVGEDGGRTLKVGASEVNLTGLQEEQILMGFHNDPAVGGAQHVEVASKPSWRRL